MEWLQMFLGGGGGGGGGFSFEQTETNQQRDTRQRASSGNIYFGDKTGPVIGGGSTGTFAVPWWAWVLIAFVSLVWIIRGTR